MGLVCTCFQKCGARRACSLPHFCRTKDTGLTWFPGPGQPPDVRCISPASKSRRAASVQERSPLGVGVPRAIPAWRGWGLMLSGSEKLGTLGGDRAPLPKSQSRVEAPWPAARCAPAVLSEAANANPGSLPRCPCEPRPTPPQPEPRFLIC